MIHVHLSVKFRAFGITFATFTREWNEPISLDYRFNITPHEIIRFNERGVTLIVGIS